MSVIAMAKENGHSHIICSGKELADIYELRDVISVLFLLYNYIMPSFI